VCFELLIVVFCLDFGPSFFPSLVPLLGVFFFLSLFIYLFISLARMHTCLGRNLKSKDIKVLMTKLKWMNTKDMMIF
jgi:hypothetical protein